MMYEELDDFDLVPARKTTKISRFKKGDMVRVTNPQTQYHNETGPVAWVYDGASFPDESDEFRYSIKIKNKQSKAQFLAEDEDNEAEDYEQYENIGFFFASDLQRMFK